MKKVNEGTASKKDLKKLKKLKKNELKLLQMQDEADSGALVSSVAVPKTSQTEEREDENRYIRLIAAHKCSQGHVRSETKIYTISDTFFMQSIFSYKHNNYQVAFLLPRTVEFAGSNLTKAPL